MRLQIGKIDLVNADEIYPLVIPAGTVRLMMHTTDGTAWTLAVSKEAQEQGRYWTCQANDELKETLPKPLPEAILVYATCGSGNKVLEMLFWVAPESWAAPRVDTEVMP